MIPVVETENLRLRAHRLDDFDTYAAFWAGKRSTPFGGPFSRNDSWDSFLSDAGHWAIRGFGHWIIAQKADDVAIGWAGFVQKADEGEPELGCVVYDEHEGRSVAYEACVAACSYGAKTLGFTTPLSKVDDWNTRSIRLAERLGATLEATKDIEGHTVHFFRHPAPKVAA